MRVGPQIFLVMNEEGKRTERGKEHKKSRVLKKPLRVLTFKKLGAVLEVMKERCWQYLHFPFSASLSFL